MNAPSDAARTVRTNVWNDDAAPATWPNGVMAIDEKLEPMKPIMAILAVISARKIGNDVGAICVASNCNAPNKMKVSRAVCDTRRAPKRSTILELVKLEVAMPIATIAKPMVKNSAALKTLSNSCCELLR